MDIRTSDIFNDSLATRLFAESDLTHRTAQAIIADLANVPNIIATINYRNTLPDILEKHGIMRRTPEYAKLCVWLKECLINESELSLNGAIIDGLRRSRNYWESVAESRESRINSLLADCRRLEQVNQELATQITVADGIIAQAEETAEQLKHYDELKAAFSASEAHNNTLKQAISSLYQDIHQLNSGKESQQEVICAQEDRIRQLEKLLCNMMIERGKA